MQSYYNFHFNTVQYNVVTPKLTLAFKMLDFSLFIYLHLHSILIICHLSVIDHNISIFKCGLTVQILLKPCVHIQD